MSGRGRIAPTSGKPRAVAGGRAVHLAVWAAFLCSWKHARNSGGVYLTVCNSNHLTFEVSPCPGVELKFAEVCW